MTRNQTTGSERVLVVAGPDEPTAGITHQLRRRTEASVTVAVGLEAALTTLDEERCDCLVTIRTGNGPTRQAVREALETRGIDRPVVPVPETAARGETAAATPAWLDHLRTMLSREPNRWNRFRTTLWEIAEEALAAPTRQEIDARVCKEFAARRSFAAAWICSHPPDETPRTVAGESEQALERSHTVIEQRDATAPWRRAAERREPAIESVEQPELAWDGAVTVCSVPLLHRRINYGVLTVATQTWDPAGLEPVVDELDSFGRTVGHALATSEIQQQSELFKQAIEQADPAIAMLDTDGTIEYVNDAFESVFGYGKAAAVGASLSLLGPEESLPTVAAIDMGEPWRDELVCQRADGRRIHITLSVAAVPVEGGTSRKYVAIASDITALKRHEQRLQVLNRVLRHNLRNDLNVVRGHMRNAIDQLDGSEQAVSLRTAVETVDSLLTLSKKARYIETNIEGPSGEATRIDIVPVIEEVLAAIRQQHSEVDVTASLPASCCVLAPDFELAFREAVTNAIEHNDADQPRVRVRVTTDEEEFVEVLIADNGPGIPEHERTVLDAERETDLQHGSSIGLWLIKWVVSYAGGRLGITDSEMDGTRVTLRLRTEECRE